MNSQGDLDFHTGDTSGYEAFRKNREEEAQRLARNSGLPLGQWVTVRLRDGRELSGRLLAVEDPALVKSSQTKSTKFKVDGIIFPSTEIDSCMVI